ncbi:MAG: DMT family transporter [Alphaproteobacteria bacterium]|nr:DMT family transporter [Alphaproteobacteria bacterium]
MLTSCSQFWASSPHFRGALWKVTSFLCFAAINGIVRYLSQTAEATGQFSLPAYEIAFFQNLFGLVFLVPWILQNGPGSLKTRYPLLQTFRIALSAIGVVLMYTALAQMQLAQAVGLMFLGPLITALGARLFLKENIGKERAVAIVIGFIGGAIISKTTFSSGMWSLLAFLPVLAATCFSGATLMIRRLTVGDSPQLIATYLLLFMVPLLFIPTLMYGHMPASWQWPWLLIMGGLAAGAHLCLNKAYSSAEVSYLIPYGFTKWFASAIIGFAAFGEIPSSWTCLGAFILMGAIISLSYSEARRSLRKSINSSSYSKMA